MISCGSTSLKQFHDTAELVQVSQQTFTQNSEDVQRNERPTVV
jgi:IMP dehydrogenase